MRLYYFEVKWDGDIDFTYAIVESNTKIGAEKLFKQNCKDGGLPTEFEKYKCERLILENGFKFIN